MITTLDFNSADGLFWTVNKLPSEIRERMAVVLRPVPSPRINRGFSVAIRNKLEGRFQR